MVYEFPEMRTQQCEPFVVCGSGVVWLVSELSLITVGKFKTLDDAKCMAEDAQVVLQACRDRC